MHHRIGPGIPVVEMELVEHEGQQGSHCSVEEGLRPGALSSHNAALLRGRKENKKRGGRRRKRLRLKLKRASKLGRLKGSKDRIRTKVGKDDKMDAGTARQERQDRGRGDGE